MQKNGATTRSGNRSVSMNIGVFYSNFFSSSWQRVSVSCFHLRPVTKYTYPIQCFGTAVSVSIPAVSSTSSPTCGTLSNLVSSTYPATSIVTLTITPTF